MLEILKSRRSIRKYKDTPIEKDKIDKIIKSALLAPSSMNKKPVELIVVNEKSTLEKLEKCKNMGTLALKTSPVAIVVIGDSLTSDVWIEDASIVSTLIQLEAESLGLGSCWIQMRNRQGENDDSEKEVRNVLNIPDNYGVLSIITLGYKDEEKIPYDESSFNFNKIHYNKF
ncbi:nitroreductase family protein [Clostridium paraputrificum]|uniref:nitroreductase family protein n=1 Tax=Clostridium paraputrificum TaxID=29363 RepID=UPI00325BF44A